MSAPYLGEIRAFGFNFAPLDWAMCNGQMLPIAQYDALFNLLGTTYGGDGVNTFGVPNLQGRVPIHQGTGKFTTVIGQVMGSSQITLTAAQLPAHTHMITAAQVPSGGVVDRIPAPSATSYLADASDNGVYLTNPGALNATLAAGAIGTSGGSQPHVNAQPYLVITFCIALFGIYPSQN